ncbi:NRAMP family divalent metal transporter [Microbacterium sp. USTB-Y]|uniref:NRAMP family divalent metal transporter n=1 Tax=Microbacterium sp. USTB-Y TaxID=2823692 RepID=UPI00203FFA4B|nr:divalent metal cation transporter [Microbacterium sp. USTB-Y]
MTERPADAVHGADALPEREGGAPVARPQRRVGRLLKILGPGLVTGAADDDPSGIATYSQAGAQFGFATLWTMLLTFPLMVAVQDACMRIGAVTGKGLAAVVRDQYPKRVLYPVVALLVSANTFNIGSDIGAMAASTQLLMPGIPIAAIAIAFVVLIIGLEVFISYKVYIRILKWLALALFAYVVTAFLITVPWNKALLVTVIPHVQLDRSFLYIVVGIFGTTISPYLFFWQTSNTVEDEIAERREDVGGSVPRISKNYVRRLRIDTTIGMFFSNLIAWFIILVGAVVLNTAGVTNITTAADAAKALQPLVNSFPNSGYIAQLIFAIGVIGIGLMSIPVLAGSSAYAVAEAFRWHEGLSRRFTQARGFYAVIIAGTLIGLLLNFVGLDPLQALVLTAVINGIVAVPLIFLIIRLSSRHGLMGEHRSGPWSRVGLWTAFAVMAAAAIALLLTTI